jgi:hypothetical protein
MVLIFWVVDIDGNLSRYYCRCIDIWEDLSIHLGFIINIFHFDLIIDGTSTCPTAIVSMSMSQPITLMAPSAGDDDTVDNVSMAYPSP